MTFSYDLNYPEIINSMFESLGSVSRSGEFVLSFDCILFGPNEANPTFIKQFIYSLLPLAGMLLSLIVWCLAKMVFKKTFKGKIKRNIMITTFVNIFLLMPLLIGSTFNMINCKDINGTSRLDVELSIECWTDEHKQWILVVCLINMLWIIIFPIIIFVLLRRNRNQLDNPSAVKLYGLFYIGLKD